MPRWQSILLKTRRNPTTCAWVEALRTDLSLAGNGPQLPCVSTAHMLSAVAAAIASQDCHIISLLRFLIDLLLQKEFKQPLILFILMLRCRGLRRKRLSHVCKVLMPNTNSNNHFSWINIQIVFCSIWLNAIYCKLMLPVYSNIFNVPIRKFSISCLICTVSVLAWIVRHGSVAGDSLESDCHASYATTASCWLR